MLPDTSAIHPELRETFRKFPRFNFNRWNLRLLRLLTNLAPRRKIPDGVRVDEVFVPVPDAKQGIRLRMYRPNLAAQPAPALLWMHGGGYIIGTVKMDETVLAMFVEALGIAVLSVGYRLAPEHPFPTPLDDCYAALVWVHEHCEALGIDPGRIAVGGVSAGGGLAASLAQLARDRGEVQPVFQLLVYPMLDDRSAVGDGYPHKDLLTWTQASNRYGWECYLGQPCGLDQAQVYAVPARRENLSGLPPAWIGAGTLDLFYEENETYAQRLRKCGVDCELVVIPGAFHGFDVLDGQLRVVQEFRNAQMTTLKKYLFE